MTWLDVFARTEIGCERDRNEDAFHVLDLASGQSGILPEHRRRPLAPPGTLLAVCDGMGGAAAGDVASAIALERLAAAVLARRPSSSASVPSVEDAEAALLAGVADANAAILEYTRQNPEKHGMGTTMTAALAMGPELVIVHVGDSRAYLRRGDRLEQLTRDQNVVGQMIAAGQITADEARTSAHRNVLLEAVGVATRIGPELLRVTLRPGDVLLLCSDGLTGPLCDAHVLEILARHDNPVQCCRALTEAACAAGGPDNVTVVVGRVSTDAGSGAAATGSGEPIAFSRRPAIIGAS